MALAKATRICPRSSNPLSCLTLQRLAIHHDYALLELERVVEYMWRLINIPGPQLTMRNR